MSAPAAGKFQDHYAILGVDPKANSDAIQAAYAKLAQRYNKANAETGNPEKLDSVNLAYEVLCDPTLRIEFDKIKGIDQDDGKPQFSGLAFFDSLSRQTGLRAALLSVLYDRRQKKPYRPAISMRHLEGMLQSSIDEMSFALWYLKQRGLVQSDDKSNLQITVQGMDFLEEKQPHPDLVLPFIKPSALGVTAPPAAAAAPAAPPAASPSTVPLQKLAAQTTNETESVSKVLNRALARR
jgi:curved DNA-binding protein CbpA